MNNQTPQTLPLDVALQQALSLHQQGRLQQAEQLYRAILQAQPGQPDANHNLGVLAGQVGQPAAGLSYLKSALGANPAVAQYWLSYARTLLATGQSDEAQAILHAALQRGFDSQEFQALRQKTASAPESAAQDVAKADSGPQVRNQPGAASLGRLLKAANSAAQKRQPPKKSKRCDQEVGPAKPAAAAEFEQLTALFDMGRYLDLENQARMLLERDQGCGWAWKALGLALQMQGKDALQAFQQAAALMPADDAAHYNLGIVLQARGQSSGAVASYRRALQINPHFADAHNNLANILKDMGQLDEAAASYRHALESRPDFADAHGNLGVLLKDMGQLDDAMQCYRRALEFKPGHVATLNNCAALLHLRGDAQAALRMILRSLQIAPTDAAKNIFVNCVRSLHLSQDDGELRAAMASALSEPWGRPAELMWSGTCLLKLQPGIQAMLARAARAWPRRLPAQDLFGADGLAMLEGDSLLCRLLCAAPVNDVELERFLGAARHALLASAMVWPPEGPQEAQQKTQQKTLGLGFYAALASQCFINEYVFDPGDEEQQQAFALRDRMSAAIENGNAVPALWMLAVASYFPLHSLPHAGRLAELRWPVELDAVLAQQIREPQEEQQLRPGITRLTEIADEISQLVRGQYEENPYPRWVSVPPAGPALGLTEYFSRKFPLAPRLPRQQEGRADVLIAGCGTGLQSIDAAPRFRDAQVLAVDLSLSSLCYAKRKTRELGLSNIEYAQADLQKLGSLGREFDVIESAGVLHHLADPWAGWRTLLSLLRPGGMMMLGFYSETARRNVVKVRDFIREHGYGSSADEIRRCRQDVIERGRSDAGFASILQISDFFSTSACRDLLFHVQEHRMTLGQIDGFLRQNKLSFLGLEIGAPVLHAYRQRFSNDRAATDLGQWQIFENENPDTFIGMYQFWVQKN